MGSLNSKFKSQENVSFNAYFLRYVALILDFSSEIFIKAPSIDKNQNRAMWFLLPLTCFIWFLHDYDQNSNNSFSNDVENILDTANLLTHY